jgi:hypothetical protein
MKKLLIILCMVAAAAIPQTLIAQRKTALPFHPGELGLSAGIGITSTQIIGGEARSVPLEIGLEYFLNEKFSVRVCGGTAKYLHKDSATAAGWEIRTSLASLQPIFHFNRYKYWDIYGGFMFGLIHQNVELKEGLDRSSSTGHSGSKPPSNRLLYAALVGAKYRLGKQFNLYTEIGAGTSLLTIGAGVAIMQ